MPFRILISAPYMLPVVEHFRPTFEKHNCEIIIADVNERLEEDDLLHLIENIDGVICGDDRFTRRVLERASKLKVISKWGTGIDSIDQDVCKELGIAVKNTPNAFSEPVADSVLGYMLAFSRSIPMMDRHMKQGIWEKIPGRALRECTLGVIGVGNVGKAVIRRANAFGMRILGTDPIMPDETFLNTYKVKMTTLSDLLAMSDFVSINCNLNPTSRHLMTREKFEQMKPDAILVNTARGPIVKEDDLINALQNGEIAGAGMDVFEHEPLPQDSPLLKMDNVLLAPHNSNSSPEAWKHVHHNTINNLFDVLGSTNASNLD